MNTYHKIQTVYLRDPNNRFKTLLDGQYALPEFEYLANNIWIFTEKVDGTNIRIIYNGDTVYFRGKTNKAQLLAPLERVLEEMFPVEKFKGKFDGPVCLYGEGYGEKIQSGGKYRNGQSFVLFDVAIENFWLQRKDVEDIATYFDIDIVPIIGVGNLPAMVHRTREGFKSLWGDFTAEGIVARPETELINRRGHRIITKVKHKDF